MHDIENTNLGIAAVFIYGGSAVVLALVLGLAIRAWADRRKRKD